MRINNLDKRKIDYDKLINYGFIKDKDIYKYNTYIIDNNFRVDIEINNNKMISKLIELEFNDEYLLSDITNSLEYSSKIKDEYNKILNDILDKCTYKDVFRSIQTKRIINYINNKYNDNIEFLWEKFDDNGIFRNKKNNKWYAAILTTNKDRFGFLSNEIVELIDLMYQREDIEKVIDNKYIFPGYHMNKKSWISIILDDSVDDEEIYKLIDNSYNLSINK